MRAGLVATFFFAGFAAFFLAVFFAGFLGVRREGFLFFDFAMCGFDKRLRKARNAKESR